MKSPAAHHGLSATDRPDTRERILDAAERLFADRGFASTSVRDITAEAGCNVASVNYHFGSKESLYREMFGRLVASLREQRVSSVERALPGGRMVDLEHLLRSFAVAFLEPLLEEPGAHRFPQLVSREMLDPHLPPGFFRAELLDPVETALTRAIRAAGGKIDDETAILCVHSLIAQLVHTVRCRGLMGRGPDPVHPFTFPRVVDHIVRFTAAGIRASAERSTLRRIQK